MSQPLKDKIALVTGATRGIGKAVALELGRQGAKIIGTATSEQGVHAIDAMLKQANLSGKAYLLNLSDVVSIASFYDQVKQEIGAPNILINNAGINRDNLFLRMKPEEWDAVINTNLNGVYHLTRACIREMIRAQWGRIISMSSIVGVTGSPGQVNYAASKAAIIGFSKALAQEIASRHITVNVIAPGFIETDMTNQLTDEQKMNIKRQIPQGKYGQPEDIAAAVSFLASPQASYITGQTLHINGGMYMN